MIVLNDPNVVFDRTDSMYPTMFNKITDAVFDLSPFSTVYGFVLEGTVKIKNTKVMEQHEFFSFPYVFSQSLTVEGTAMVITRHGFKGQTVLGGPLEKQGRLCYINNCSDSLLVYPPRRGDPSMTHLQFPPGIVQDFHTHPSFRMGVIFRGRGYGESNTGKYLCEPGSVFVIEEQEVHRFITEDDQLSVVSFHPDGDWGPTDHDHTILNRTYVNHK
jgi:quercetin dioxygenase-like cupin family protein